MSSAPITLTMHETGIVAGEESFAGMTTLVFKSPGSEDVIQPLSSAAGRAGQHAYKSEQTDFELLLYLPGEYGIENGKTWPLAYTETFAALAPVGGYMGYPFHVPENTCDLKNMPIRAFHRSDDPDIPVSAQQMLVNAFKGMRQRGAFHD